MARVTYGDLVTEFAGSIGGVTFLRNASGPIAKLRTNPTVNPSPYQSTYQTNLAKLVAYWPTLSQEDKDAWDLFAEENDHTTPWADIKILSGYQWFVSVNLNRLLIETAILSSPPDGEVVPVPTSFSIQISATYIRLNFDPEWTPDEYWALYASLPLRQSSLKLRRSLFFINYRLSLDPVTTYDFTAFYESFANITWADFYASANCSIIARVKQISRNKGLASAFTSAIVKIG